MLSNQLMSGVPFSNQTRLYGPLLAYVLIIKCDQSRENLSDYILINIIRREEIIEYTYIKEPRRRGRERLSVYQISTHEHFHCE